MSVGVSLNKNPMKPTRHTINSNTNKAKPAGNKYIAYVGKTISSETERRIEAVINCVKP